MSGLPAGPVNYERWAVALLSSLGAPTCTSNLQAVVAWETAESTLAQYNPLATGLALPGSQAPAGSSVQNYASFTQGIEATRDTLLADPGYYNYANVVEDLISCAPVGVIATAIHDSYWCRGCAGGAYVIDQLRAVRHHWAEHASRSIGAG